MSPSKDAAVDVDVLPPIQYLIVEVLAARHRSGEHMWNFPKRLRPQLRALEHLGLIGYRSGPEPRTCQAWLTDAGRAGWLLDGYVTPNDAAPARLAAVWELYVRWFEDRPAGSERLLRELIRALRGDEI